MLIQVSSLFQTGQRLSSSKYLHLLFPLPGMLFGSHLFFHIPVPWSQDISSAGSCLIILFKLTLPIYLAQTHILPYTTLLINFMALSTIHNYLVYSLKLSLLPCHLHVSPLERKHFSLKLSLYFLSQNCCLHSINVFK